MSALLHTISLLLAIALAYVWLHVPFLAPYSLQVFVGSIIIFLAIKRIKKSKLFHLVPGKTSAELAVITFAFLLVVGYTGDTQSLLFSLTYILLFFLVFSTQVSSAIITTAVVMLYLYALAPDPGTRDYVNLATLPLMLFFFIFAKAQYQQVTQEREQVAREEQALADTVNNTEQLHSFMVNFLKPKLEYLTTLLSHPAQNKQALQGQLTLLQVEIEKVVSRSEQRIQVTQEITIKIDEQEEPVADSETGVETAAATLQDSDETTA